MYAIGGILFHASGSSFYFVDLDGIDGWQYTARWIRGSARPVTIKIVRHIGHDRADGEHVEIDKE